MRKYIGIIITSLILILTVGALIWPGRLIKKTVDYYVSTQAKKENDCDFKNEPEALRKSAEKETPDTEKKNKSTSDDKKKTDTDNKPESKFGGFESATPRTEQKPNTEHRETPSIIKLPEPKYKTEVPKTTPKPTATPTPEPTPAPTPSPTSAPAPEPTPTPSPALPPDGAAEEVPVEGDYRGTEGIENSGEISEEKQLENQNEDSVDSPIVSLPDNDAETEAPDPNTENNEEAQPPAKDELPGLEVSEEITLPFTRVKVGLYYYDEESEIRNHTVPYTTLMRSRTESDPVVGYRFGFFDDKREFVEIGYTDYPNLIICKDNNISIKDKYETGCFHIMLNKSFNTFDEALSFINEKAEMPGYGEAFPMRYLGSYRVLLGQYKSNLEALKAINDRGVLGNVVSGTASCVSVLNYDTGEVIFEFDEGQSKNLAVSPTDGETGEKPQTWIGNFKYYGDFEFSRRTDDLTVINVLDIEDYVRGVLSYEMSPSWPAEALKAQAVCARTYAANHFGAYKNYGFDVSNDIFSQVYKGANRSVPFSDEQVTATEGLYLTYNGKLISAMYSSSHGGGSENSKNVFGGDVAYLRGVVDPYEASTKSLNKFSSWTRTFGETELRDILREKFDQMIGGIEKIETEKSPTGNTILLRFICEKYKTIELKGPKCYSFSTGNLRLPGIRYTVTKEGGNFKFEGSGWGHSLGLSQFGAYGMAANYDFSFDQILGFYYNDVSLAKGTK